MTIIRHDLQHLSRDLVLPFLWLITIGVARDHYRHGLPFRIENKFFEKFGGILLYNDLTFEVETSAETIILMSVPCVAINASMLTPLVRVHRIHIAEVWTVYLVNDLLRVLFVDLGWQDFREEARQDLQYDR